MTRQARTSTREPGEPCGACSVCTARSTLSGPAGPAGADCEPDAGAETPGLGLAAGSLRAAVVPMATSELSERLETCRGLCPLNAGVALSENSICRLPTAIYAMFLKY